MKAKFTKEKWHSGVTFDISYVQMNSTDGPQGGFRITRSDKNNQAIANLIAAAPEMYECLQAIYESNCMQGLDTDEDILQALAKARGES